MPIWYVRLLKLPMWDEHSKGKHLVHSWARTQVSSLPSIPVLFPAPDASLHHSVCLWELTKWSEVKDTQSCLTLCNPMDYTVHGILQARILEWVAIPFSRGSSPPRDWTQVSQIAGRFFTSWVTREAQECIDLKLPLQTLADINTVKEKVFWEENIWKRRILSLFHLRGCEVWVVQPGSSFFSHSVCSPSGEHGEHVHLVDFPGRWLCRGQCLAIINTIIYSTAHKELRTVLLFGTSFFLCVLILWPEITDSV